MLILFSSSYFFFIDTATTEIYTNCPPLSRHDALPICDRLIPLAGAVVQQADTVPGAPLRRIEFCRPLQVKQGCLLRSEEHTSELQSLMRILYAVFCLKNNKQYLITDTTTYVTSHLTLYTHLVAIL